MGRVKSVTVSGVGSVKDNTQNTKTTTTIRKAKNIVKKIESFSDIIIEKGIPVPNLYHSGLRQKIINIFETMDQGDSFFIDERERGKLVTVINAITHYNKKYKINGKSFQRLGRRKIEGGHRVWRFV